jgi:plastocyanin
MTQTSSPPASAAPGVLAARVAGAALLAATGGIHLDLYLTGYRHIPTIGPLFLLQVIAAFVLAVAVLALRNPLADAAGAGFALATLGGYLLTLWVGLFGFKEVRTTAGLVAGLLEAATIGVLGYAAIADGRGAGALAEPLTRLRQALPGGAAVAAGAAAVVAAVVLGISVGTASGSSGSSTASSGGGTGGGSGGVVKIVIKNFKFTPSNPDVQPGEKIQVTNEDGVTHDFTAGPTRHKNLFSTSTIGPNQTKIILAPTQAGMYPFYCTIHPFMTGILIVGK